MAGNASSGRGGKAKERNESTYQRKFSYNCPSFLNKLGKEYWKRNLPHFVAHGVIDDKDFDAFCRLCDLYSKWRSCQEITSTLGCTYETLSDKGYNRYMKRPEVELEIQFHRQMQGLEKHFGLNPVDGKNVAWQKKNKKLNARDRYKLGGA